MRKIILLILLFLLSEGLLAQTVLVKGKFKDDSSSGLYTYSWIWISKADSGLIIHKWDSLKVYLDKAVNVQGTVTANKGLWDSLKVYIDKAVNVQGNVSIAGLLDSIKVNNELTREMLGYYPDSIVKREVLSVVEMDSILDDQDREQIWTPNSADSSKIRVILSMFINNSSDSSQGYDIQIRNNRVSPMTYTSIFTNTGLIGTELITFLPPLKFPPGQDLFIRKILPNGAIYTKYKDGVLGKGVHITMRYRYR